MPDDIPAMTGEGHAPAPLLVIGSQTWNTPDADGKLKCNGEKQVWVVGILGGDSGLGGGGRGGGAHLWWGACGGCLWWGACCGVHVVGCLWWGACGGVHVVGCMLWGACGGVLVVGCMLWGACGGAPEG
eukprot:290763-Chlamydomonas_euryale.AAC.1